MLKPLALMFDRIDRARSDSDIALFHELLYAGELILKLHVATTVAAIQDDRDRHRYRLLYNIIRADGLGEWSRALDDALTGPASQFFLPTSRDDRRVLTERVSVGNWQYDIVRDLHEVLNLLGPANERIPDRVAARQWFSSFVEIRNKTRGHGAPTAGLCNHACVPLERSIRTICSESPVLSHEWVYLHQNLSGKYRVIDLGNGRSHFAALTSKTAVESQVKFGDGVYAHLGAPVRIELLFSDADLS